MCVYVCVGGGGRKLMSDVARMIKVGMHPRKKRTGPEQKDWL